MKKLLAVVFAGLFTAGAWAITPTPASVSTPMPQAKATKSEKTAKAKHHRKHAKKAGAKKQTRAV